MAATRPDLCIYSIRRGCFPALAGARCTDIQNSQTVLVPTWLVRDVSAWSREKAAGKSAPTRDEEGPSRQQVTLATREAEQSQRTTTVRSLARCRVARLLV